MVSTVSPTQLLIVSRLKVLTNFRHTIAITAKRVPKKIKLYDIAFVCRLLIALSTASTITPTSANTAIPIVANPKKASSKTATLIRMANQAFCKAI